jgi:hypothetical protein
MSYSEPSGAEPAARMWEAESIVALLAKMDPDQLPDHEGQAVGACQARAVEDWLAAYIESR